MKRVEIIDYGEPAKVVRCAEVSDVGEPDEGEIVFDVLATPINPADLAFCAGNYRLKPPLPAVPGAESVGRVAAVGSKVTHLSLGDLVMNLERENWTQRRRLDASRVIKLPPNIDVAQAAMLRINPPTAHLLLSDIVALAPGDWIVQNVANSAVGKLIISMARARGLRTANIVRRTEAMAELRELGADVCVLDTPDVGTQIRSAARGGAVKLGLDAVSGDATGRIAAALDDEGTVCTYGAMSGNDPALSTPEVIFRGINLTGFLLGRALSRRSSEETQALYNTLAQEVIAGTIRARVERIYDIAEIAAAVAHAQAGGRHGKILIAPNRSS